ncbi:MAG: alpha/beta fold hydrolase [Desulfobulbus sp.]|jgi:pimeloyl-ACP methyl ester carboxylesterase
MIPLPSRRLVELDFNVTRWTEMPAGDHFVAWEEPQAFAREVAAFFAENRWVKGFGVEE